MSWIRKKITLITRGEGCWWYWARGHYRKLICGCAEVRVSEGEMAPLDLSVVRWQTDEIFKCLFEDDEKSVGFRSFRRQSDMETDGPGDSRGRFCLCYFLTETSAALLDWWRHPPVVDKAVLISFLFTKLTAIRLPISASWLPLETMM